MNLLSARQNLESSQVISVFVLYIHYNAGLLPRFCFTLTPNYVLMMNIVHEMFFKICDEFVLNKMVGKKCVKVERRESRYEGFMGLRQVSSFSVGLHFEDIPISLILWNVKSMILFFTVVLFWLPCYYCYFVELFTLSLMLCRSFLLSIT